MVYELPTFKLNKPFFKIIRFAEKFTVTSIFFFLHTCDRWVFQDSNDTFLMAGEGSSSTVMKGTDTIMRANT